MDYRESKDANFSEMCIYLSFNTDMLSFYFQTLMEFTELLSSNNNFSNYRKVFNLCCAFKIPILWVPF